MSKKEKKFSRRDFFKISGAVGAGSLAASAGKLSRASDKLKAEPSNPEIVPTRPFGRTGIKVSMLGLGGSQDLISKQILLRQAVKLGVTYWDTAHSYEGGNSEKAIGNYFARYADDRGKIFLVTKTPSSNPDQMSQYLQTSLERLQTSYIDMFFIHSVSNVKDKISPSVRDWVETAKAQGRIRFFGFSTHKNMEQCLTDGAKLGWIDGIMTSYNFRLMHTDAMKKAVDACVEAGIGLTAMKTQAGFFASFYAKIGKANETASKLTEQFTNRGFTPEQAKLKAVWENPHIASICSEMPNMAILQANVAAAADKIELSFQDQQLLAQYARETAFGYCTGCADLCESAVSSRVPVSDIMRSLMYYHNYGNHKRAARLFNTISPSTRRRLTSIDYTRAEHRCPQNLPIGEIMQKMAATFTENDA